MQTSDEDFQKRLLATFKVEAGEHVQILSAGLVELEQANAMRRGEILENIFREAHSLKGAARAVGATLIETICQSLESAFSAAKRDTLHWSAQLFDVLHEAVEGLSKQLPKLGSQGTAADKAAASELARRIDRAVRAPQPRTTGPAAPEAPAPVPAAPSVEPPPALSDTVRIQIAKLDTLLFQSEGLLGVKLSSAERAMQLRDALDVLSGINKNRTNLVDQLSLHADGAAQHGEELRKLSELVLAQKEDLQELESRLKSLVREAEQDQRALSAMVDELLEDMKSVLMQPVATVFEGLGKLARDLARSQGKEVELSVLGAELEVDRRILETMRDPLIHLLRNCMDHGIEAPAVRAAGGKPTRGKITCSAAQKAGSRIELVVADDGAGIDVARVEHAARKLGFNPASDDSESREAASLALVFQSGVSTSPIITDLSGRGLGLAIVREKVERLGGSIAIETQPRAGTTFRILLPVTLATLRGVHVRAGEHRLVVPTRHVERVLRIDRGLVKTIEGRPTVQCDGHTIALIRMEDVLELAPRARHAEQHFVHVVLVRYVSERIAFAVDEILEEQEFVMKPLGRQLQRVRNVAGAAVLGTGKAVPVLDVPDLMRSAAKIAAAPISAPSEVQQEQHTKGNVLVTEDSITSRALLKNILESAGYTVATAADGADAFTSLKLHSYDLVVSDVEMPRMNGFDLTAKIRADPALRELPVVLVTALGTREDRERGADVGANAYIVKSSFDQSNLVEVVRRLI